MKDRYRCEMDRLEPRPEKLNELYEMIEGGTEMKQAKRLSRKAAAAILVCAALMITVAAAAAPAVWETLWRQLGAFAPYAQTIDGAVCRDQGIEVQVLSALSDDLEARVYLSVRDVEGDRLDDCLTLRGNMSVEMEEKPEPDRKPPLVSVGSSVTDHFELLSYDSETKTALFSASVLYGDLFKEALPPIPAVQVAVTGMTTREMTVNGEVSCAGVTGETLDSLPVGEEDRVIFWVDSIGNSPYTAADLPAEKVVLAPEQNPMPLEGVEDIWVSSMGFASDGCFHIRLGFGEGIGVPLDESGEGRLYSDLLREGEDDDRQYTFQATLVPGGMDILFPLIGIADLEMLQSGQARVSGTCTRPGVDLTGSWNIDFQMEYHPSMTLDWTGELAGQQVEQVTLSPLSVTMHSIGPGGFSSVPLYAARQDGSTITAKSSTGRYSNIGYGTGETLWDVLNTWKFEEPVDLEELACLTLLDETIPVNPS